MPRYEPSTERGRALRALADEILATVELPMMLRPALPMVERELDKTIAGVDAQPEAATAALRPLVARVAAALDLTAEDLQLAGSAA